MSIERLGPEHQVQDVLPDLPEHHEPQAAYRARHE